MRNTSILLLAASLGLAACATDQQTDDTDDPQSLAADEAAHAVKHVMPTLQVHRLAPQSAVDPGNGIVYHGGSVMTSQYNLAYFIWYGNWQNNTATTILETFMKNLGGSPWFNINTSYNAHSGLSVVNKMKFGGSITDNYSHGTALDDNAIQAIVSDAITQGKLPAKSDGIYFVLTSSDVTETSGFCSAYCGWHYFGTINNLRIKYAFIGNPDQCPTACEIQQTSPNNNAGADGMASIIAHELSESVTDPYVSAWYDTSGEENADKCAWTFGTEQTASNGSQYNVTLGGLNFLIQQNWINANGGSCGLSY